MKFSKKIASTAALIAVSSAAQAQTYSWLTTTQGDTSATAGQTVNWDWNWNLGGQNLSGTLTTTRNSDSDYLSGSVGSNAGTGAFSNSPYGDSLEGASGIREVATIGDGQSTVYQYNLAPGTATPTNTIISLSDPGHGVLLSSATTTYSFSATLNGVAVDTSQWTMVVEYPHPLLGVPPANISWNGSTVTASGYTTMASVVVPDSMVYLNTNGTRFDSLTITSSSTASGDYFGVGLGAVITPVPEPGTALLATLGLLGWFARARLSRDRDAN